MSFDLWTLGFQAVNVLVLVWLLHRFFWKPVAGMIVTRQTAAATLLEEAEAVVRVVTDDDHAPFVPVAQHVETEPADLDWSPTEGVRDPFAPLVLPSAE